MLNVDLVDIDMIIQTAVKVSRKNKPAARRVCRVIEVFCVQENTSGTAWR